MQHHKQNRGRHSSKAPARRMNPISTGVAVGLAIVGIGAAGAGAGYLWKRRKQKKANELPPSDVDPDEVLKEFVQIGADLEGAPEVVADIMQPIKLAKPGLDDRWWPKVSELAVYANNGALALDSALFGETPIAPSTSEPNTWYGWMGDKSYTGKKTPKAIALLVTNVTPEFARAAYEWMLSKISVGSMSNEADDWTRTVNGAVVSTTRDEVVQEVLETIAPDLDWSQGISPYRFGDAAYYAWTATELLGEVARQSWLNKQGTPI
jgi:hypothetical protein